jgi:WD40 repeat protein
MTPPTVVSVPSSPSISSPSRQFPQNFNIENHDRKDFDEKGVDFDLGGGRGKLLRDRIISCNDVIRMREGSGLGARIKLLMKSSDENRTISCKLNSEMNVNEILNNYSRKLKNNCYNSTSTAYGNGTEIFRDISMEPERILDAPGIVDDFYLNCMSWSVKDILAIGLAGSVYLWNARSGEVDELCNLNGEEEAGSNDYVASLSWIHDGSHLAIGSSDSSVQIWDVNKSKRMRMFAGHTGRVSAVAWNKHILSTGAHDGQIHTNDVRIAKHLISKQIAHKGQVCGLQWSYDGRQLASGSNDNNVHIWEGSMASLPIYSFTHCAAVKALSWCPWQSNTLVTGGGSRDRQLKFWNTSTGTCSRSIDTGSQVSSVMWSKTYRELISAHGSPTNSLFMWKYPSLAQVKEIPSAHDSRILHMAMSPDGERIATVAADENLKIWKVFEKPPIEGKQGKILNIDRPLVTISHMTETSAKFKSPQYAESSLSRR